MVKKGIFENIPDYSLRYLFLKWYLDREYSKKLYQLYQKNPLNESHLLHNTYSTQNITMTFCAVFFFLLIRATQQVERYCNKTGQVTWLSFSHCDIKTGYKSTVLSLIGNCHLQHSVRILSFTVY